MNRLWQAFTSLVVRHRLVFAVAAVIGVAITSTAISMSLYISSGASSLDLSRPGYSQARSAVKNVPSESFSATGNLDYKAAEQFKQAYETQRATLDSFGDFRDAALDDASLQFVAP